MAPNSAYDLHVGKRVTEDEIYRHDVRSEFNEFVQKQLRNTKLGLNCIIEVELSLSINLG
jgi:hypothetical protein